MRVTCCWVKLDSLTSRHREIARTMMNEGESEEEEDREPAVIREPDEERAADVRPDWSPLRRHV